MKGFVKSAVKNMVNSLISCLSKGLWGVKLLNRIYENATSIKLINFIWGSTPRPKFDFTWSIKLLNGNVVKVPVKAADKKSWEFALSYKWSDKSLTIAESALHDYYDKHYCFIDIGANLGLRTLYPLSVKRPVILFEPNGGLKKFTQEVYVLNEFSGYAFENICLSEQNGEINFYISPSSYMSSIYKENAEMDKEEGKVKVEIVKTTTLDSYLEHKLQIKPKIIKIDTEGNEYSILKGALNTIQKHQPAIIVEILPQTKNGVELYNLLKDFGYICFALSDEGNVSSIYEIKMHTALDFSKVNNFLFVNDAKLSALISDLITT